MSAQEFKPGDRVRFVGTRKLGEALVPGEVYTVEYAHTDGCCISLVEQGVDGYFDHAPERFEPEFVVGQQVSGDDYKRLPVGSKIEDSTNAATKVDENTWRWDDGEEDANEDVRMGRTLTHLGDGTHAEPEDKDDLYVEPEPLKEGDWCLIWAQFDTVEPDDDGDVTVDVPGSGLGTQYVRADAIVRPDAGQVPPWVKPAQCTSLWADPFAKNDGATLRRCKFDAAHDGRHRADWSAPTGHILNRTWADAEAYGCVEVSS